MFVNLKVLIFIRAYTCFIGAYNIFLNCTFLMQRLIKSALSHLLEDMKNNVFEFLLYSK